MSEIGDRIKEERERLGLTQPQFAEAAGAAKRTLIEWEKGATAPTAVQLSALGKIGVDMLYILTGQRTGGTGGGPSTSSGSAITPRETALLDNYRACAEEDQRAIDRVALCAAEAQRIAGELKDVKKRA
jgi:transcriptional regulator with XRE-family HTH domain